MGFENPRDSPKTEQPKEGLPKVTDNVRDSGQTFVFGRSNTIMKKFFPLFAVIIVLVLAVCSFHIIPTGYTGVKTSFGQIQKTTIQSGKLNFCIPFVQSMK